MHTAPTPERSAADTAAEIVLTLAAGLALFTAALCVWLIATGATEDTETGLYVVTFALILPATLAGVPPLAAALRARGILVAAAALWTTGLLLVLLGARLAYAVHGASAPTSSPLFLAALAAWAGAAAATMPWLPRLARMPAAHLFALPATTAGIALLSFVSARSLEPGQLGAALLVAGAFAGLYHALTARRLRGRAGIAIDVLVVVLALVAVNDLSLYQDPEAFVRSTADIHQNFYLGPANDAAHGRTVLVEVFSQYGPGPLLLLGAWFQLADIGYGGLTLLGGLLTATLVAVTYAIARVAGASRPLGLLGALLIVLTCVFIPDVPPSTWFPSSGGLRYLPAYAVILAVLVGGRPGAIGAPLAVGIAALWSFETFAYTTAAYVAMVALGALCEGGRGRAVLRRAAVGLAPAAATVVGFHALFAVSTLAVSGDWPRWGWYLDYLSVYSVDELGALPIEPWSPGLLLAAVYFSSICALAVLVRRAPELVRRERRVMTALAGTASLGAITFAYFAGRSDPEVASVLAAPCILSVTLWLSLLERGRESLVPRLRTAAGVVPAVAAGVLAVSVWPTLQDRAGHTALALALPDGGADGSVRDELRRMWDSPPVHPPVPAGASLIAKHFPGDGPARVLLENELTTEVLMEAERPNALPVSHWTQDGLVLDRSWPRVRRAVENLEPGALILTHTLALMPDPPFPEPLLQRTAAAIQRRFKLVIVDGDPAGLFVARLEERVQ